MAQVATTGSWLSCLACYGGGVILATCFTHMMPEVVTVVLNSGASGDWSRDVI